MTPGMEKAAHLRAQLAAGRALIERHGGIDRAANAILSTPNRSQRWADMRERHAQGPHLSDDTENTTEDAMDLLEASIDVEVIALEETADEPELPKIQGNLAAIFMLADAGRSPQQIADAIGLTKRRINQILQDKEGKLPGQITAATLQTSMFPPLTLADIRPRERIRKPRKPKPGAGRRVTATAGQGVLV